MPSFLKRSTIDELYRRLRDLDYTQVDERIAVILNAIHQLEEQGECRESATEAVLMVGYTTDGISNQEQTRWLSWNVDGAIRGLDLARNPGYWNPTTDQTISQIYRPEHEYDAIDYASATNGGSVSRPQYHEERA